MLGCSCLQRQRWCSQCAELEEGLDRAAEFCAEASMQRGKSEISEMSRLKTLQYRTDVRVI